MLSTEFNDIFQTFPNFRDYYVGNFSADNLPKKLKTFEFAIINTDISANKGLHWYAAFKSSKTLEVFDSLGIDESKKLFLRNNLRLPGIKEIIFNSTQFQKNDTNSCGKYVLYFLINRLHNIDHSFGEILEEIFVPDLDKNEKKVQDFYEDLLN